jgi:hypothetical protein
MVLFIGSIVLVICLGLIPAKIAESKGRQFALWWLYGICLFIVALFHSLIIKKIKNCIDCAAVIPFEARICSMCGKDQWKHKNE